MPIPKILITAAMMAAQVAIGAMRKIEGPRLESLKVTVAEYGTPLEDFWGIRRLPGRPMIWADDLREEKKTSKTKGGKYAEYKYYGDWAVAVAGHEIEAVRRIWFDEHLVYQVGDPGPVSLGGFAADMLARIGGRVLKIGQGRNLRIYFGTEDQSVDPLMDAWFEDHVDFGANCCSAHRGTAYIVFQDIPLEKFGNRIPQVTVEAISGKTDAFPYEQRAHDNGLSTGFFSPDYSRLIIPYAGGLETWDIPTRTLLHEGGDGELRGAAAMLGSNIYADDTSNNILLVDDFGNSTVLIPTPGTVEAFYTAAGKVCVVIAGAGNNAFYISGSTVVAIACGFIPSFYFGDYDGNTWGLTDNGANIEFVNLDTGDTYTVASPSAGDPWALDNGEGSFFVYQGGTIMLIDKATMTVTADVASTGVTFPGAVFRNASPGAYSIWFYADPGVLAYEYDTSDLSEIRSVDIGDWISDGSQSVILYDPINHALLCQPNGSGFLTWRYLDRVGSGGVTLQAIVEQEGDRVDCDITATALDQIIDGYSVGPGPAKDRISPLLDLHDSILRPHDFGIQGIKRGTSSAGTIDVADFVRSDARYIVDVAQDNDLPLRMEVKYAALNNDQEVNTVIALRHTGAVDTARVTQIDMGTYADTPDAMQQKADRFLRRVWNSRSTVNNGLTPKYIGVEPGDIYDLDLDGVVWSAELEKLTFAEGSLKCEWRRTFPSLNALGSGTAPDMDGRDDDAILILSQTKGFILDIPLIEDADNDINPLIYAAAGKYTSTWTGAVVWEGSDGTYDDDVAAIDSSLGATWGFTTDALATANHNLWDRGNTFSVTVFGGSLANSTESAINVDGTINQFAIGANGRWEIANFTTATLTASTTISKTYTVSGLLRGRRGTEGNVGTHLAGDYFVMLSAAQIVPLGTDAIGDALSYKVQSLGRDPEMALAIDMTFTGATLKPYAPAYLKATKDPSSGDWTFAWDRRTRVGGNWNGSTIPLSEDSEEYELDILDGADVVRTISAASKTATWTAAQQTTDFGSGQSSVDIALYQLSATVGRGFAAEATF